jgi:hypothetical protein
MARRSWSDLDPRTRQRILLAGSVEAALRIAALIDLARRPATSVRGSKRSWALALVAVNSFGLLPALYFLRGRRS